MVDNKYNIPITIKDFADYLKITKNSIFKLLCLYEENDDWEKSLQTILLEMSGIYELFNNKVNFIKVIGKLESLKHKDITIAFFRKTVFEILTLLDGEIKNELLRLV